MLDVQLTSIDPQPMSYANSGTMVTGANEILFITAQIPETEDGVVPEGFDEQCRQVWRNLLAILHKSGMTERNIAKITIYLSDRKYREQNTKIRNEVLGDHCPAMAIAIAGVLDEAWLLEIDAIAVA